MRDTPTVMKIKYHQDTTIIEFIKSLTETFTITDNMKMSITTTLEVETGIVKENKEEQDLTEMSATTTLVIMRKITLSLSIMKSKPIKQENLRTLEIWEDKT